jgi:aminoglycoside phosphotransferase (APT) family kinase protein
VCEIAPADGRAGLNAALVRRLIAAQFPQWAQLPVSPVEADGHDNRTYRLGEKLAVRLPTADSYAAGVAKEDYWLRLLAPLLPHPVPEPVVRGAPGEGYPFPWSVRRWLPGETASMDGISDLGQFAADLAEFLRALQRIDTTGGPPAGAHSFYRGAPLTHYDGETRQCLSALKGRIDTSRVEEVWDAALSAKWQGPPVWFHGDVAVGNLLVRDGRLAAVIDFGQVGVGDPACDLVIAWTFLSGDARERFRQAMDQDAATWARARGWALWKALLGLANGTSGDGQTPGQNRRVIEHVLADKG